MSGTVGWRQRRSVRVSDVEGGEVDSQPVAVAIPVKVFASQSMVKISEEVVVVFRKPRTCILPQEHDMRLSLGRPRWGVVLLLAIEFHVPAWLEPLSCCQQARNDGRIWGIGANQGHTWGESQGFLKLRLRGGAQGWYMDEYQKTIKRGRAVMRNPEEKAVVDTMMSLEAFPEALETKPIEWVTEVRLGGCTLTSPTFNENRIVYNPVGGDDRAYRGVGLAGMAVHDIRQWPYSIPEVVGHRSWKNVTIEGVKVHKRPSAAACRVSTSTSWRFKMELKEKKKALRGVLAKLRVRGIQAMEEERKRLQASRQMKLKNRLRAEQYQVITNPRKIAKMSKKQRKGLRKLPEPGEYVKRITST